MHSNLHAHGADNLGGEARGMMGTRGLYASLVLLACWTATVAEAQSSRAGEKWAVIALHQDGVRNDETHKAQQLFEERLLAFKTPSWAKSPGLTLSVLPGRAASALYVSRYSRNPQPITDRDVAELAKLSSETLRNVAHERFSEARVQLEEILGRARAALESVNRNAEMATYVLDACLMDVRVALKTRPDRADALLRAMKCRGDVPDAEPSPNMHPPEVIAVFQEAVSALLHQPMSRLVIRSLGQTGCLVYLNGRAIGRTPYVLSDAHQRRYLVQVECRTGKPGRVHEVELKDQPLEIDIDDDLDSALVTDADGISLHYASPLPPSIVPFHDQWSAANARRAMQGTVIRGTPEGLFAERLVRHITTLRERLGVSHLAIVHLSDAEDVVVSIVEADRLTTNVLPWFDFGQPRHSCAVERPPWVDMLLTKASEGEELRVFSRFERLAIARERTACGRDHVSVLAPQTSRASAAKTVPSPQPQSVSQEGAP